jgi:hypothetical protein
MTTDGFSFVQVAEDGLGLVYLHFCFGNGVYWIDGMANWD